MTAADGLKVEAVGRVVERLLRSVSEHPDCEVMAPLEPLASELRAIVDSVVPTGKTPTEHAMIELAMWSAWHATRASRDTVMAALASELALQFQDLGVTREFFLDRCAQTWESLRMARNAIDASGLSVVSAGAEPDCGDSDCSACDGAPGASEGCLPD